MTRAHLRNMAVYTFGLRLLRHIHDAERAGRPFLSMEQAVHRLTGELADRYGLDAGHLRVGERTDVLKRERTGRFRRAGEGRSADRHSSLIPHGLP